MSSWPSNLCLVIQKVIEENCLVLVGLFCFIMIWSLQCVGLFTLKMDWRFFIDLSGSVFWLSHPPLPSGATLSALERPADHLSKPSIWTSISIALCCIALCSCSHSSSCSSCCSSSLLIVAVVVLVVIEVVEVIEVVVAQHRDEH